MMRDMESLCSALVGESSLGLDGEETVNEGGGKEIAGI
jgi:hypothetical protein